MKKLSEKKKRAIEKIHDECKSCKFLSLSSGEIAFCDEHMSLVYTKKEIKKAKKKEKEHWTHRTNLMETKADWIKRFKAQLVNPRHGLVKVDLQIATWLVGEVEHLEEENRIFHANLSKSAIKRLDA